jgi:hypothetical protein
MAGRKSKVDERLYHFFRRIGNPIALWLKDAMLTRELQWPNGSRARVNPVKFWAACWFIRWHKRYQRLRVWLGFPKCYLPPIKRIDKPFMAVMLVERHDGTFPHPDFGKKVKWVMLRAPRKAWKKFQDPEFMRKVNDKFWNKKYWNR